MRPDVAKALDELRSNVADLQASSTSTGWLDAVLTRRIIVHQKSGQSVEGSLSVVMADGLVLRAPVLLNDDNSRTQMAGEVFVPRENVAFAQLDE
jgi:hypothetical protein